jgi:hypothetical protein
MHKPDIVEVAHHLAAKAKSAIYGARIGSFQTTRAGLASEAIEICGATYLGEHALAI